MNSLGKGIIAVLTLMICMRYMVYKLDLTEISTSKSVYESAIKAASQVATIEMLDASDINKWYDGVLSEVQDIPVDYRAKNVFVGSLEKIFKAQQDGSLDGVSNIEIPMVAFVTYRYITGMTYHNTFLPPMGYSYETSSSKNLEFTLGNHVIYDGVEFKIVDDITIENKLNPENKVKLSDVLSNKDINMFTSFYQLKDYVVMDSINRYMDNYAGSSLNYTASNLNTGVSYNLGKVRKTNIGYSKLGNQAGVIDGPGMIAVVDVFKGANTSSKEGFERIVSFGGSELVKRER